jgi:hypothetical protein
MKIFEDLGESLIAVVTSAAAAIVSAICAFVLATFIGAKLIRGEMSYGVGLLFGPLAAVIVGGADFIVLFRKLRSI